VEDSLNEAEVDKVLKVFVSEDSAISKELEFEISHPSLETGNVVSGGPISDEPNPIHAVKAIDAMKSIITP